MTFYMTCDDGAKEEPFKQGALLCEECECDIVSFHSPGTGIRNSVSVYFMYEFPSSICPQFSLRPVSNMKINSQTLTKRTNHMD